MPIQSIQSALVSEVAVAVSRVSSTPSVVPLTVNYTGSQLARSPITTEILATPMPTSTETVPKQHDSSSYEKMVTYLNPDVSLMLVLLTPQRDDYKLFPKC